MLDVRRKTSSRVKVTSKVRDEKGECEADARLRKALEQIERDESLVFHGTLVEDSKEDVLRKRETAKRRIQEIVRNVGEMFDRNMPVVLSFPRRRCWQDVCFKNNR